MTLLQRIYLGIFDYVFSSTREGRLSVTLPDGRERLFGDATAIPVEIRILDWSFFKRVIQDAGVGIGETYTENLWQTAQLTAFLKLLIANKKYFDGRLKYFKGIGHLANAILHRMRRNTIENSVKNIQEHYDLSNEFFALFLDPTMTYSCAVFGNSNRSLEDAQQNKIRRMAQAIGISKDDHVLEIGCGWGAFAIQTVLETGCRWTGLTLSTEQKKWAERKIKEAGLEDRIKIQLTDYRYAKGIYDKIVSVEMIEAVGHEYLNLFFECCAQFLKPGGKIALQSIVIPHERYDAYRKNCDWIQKYIFPGGHLPSVEVIERHCRHSGLSVISMDRIGLDYAKTLAIWRDALIKNESRLLEMGYNHAFIRKWEYYFSYCESGFLAGFIDDIQIFLEKRAV